MALLPAQADIDPAKANAEATLVTKLLVRNISDMRSSWYLAAEVGNRRVYSLAFHPITWRTYLRTCLQDLPARFCSTCLWQPPRMEPERSAPATVHKSRPR